MGSNCMKDKHITLTLNEEQYNALKDKAEKENRTITNYAYLLLIRALKETEEESKWLINL